MSDSWGTPHASTTKIEGKFYIPRNAHSSQKFIVPDDVVGTIVYRYNLASIGRRGLDPMCGVGTIPRIIMALGGRCEANEIDPEQYDTAKAELPEGAALTLADCTDEKFLALRQESYDYIYTSLPFAWFRDYPKGLSGAAARALWRMLKHGGMLIIDSDDVATRSGISWPLAKHQKDYFGKNGFRFVESTRYIVPAIPSNTTDSNFTELAFVKTDVK